jgi:hypothetical protein
VTTFSVAGRAWANLNGSHGSHYAHQKLMDEWKALALKAIRDTDCQPVTPPVTITATVRRVTNAKADAHNVTPTIKACIDAAVTAGLIPDDHDGILRWLKIQGGPKASAPTVELTIAGAPSLPPVYRGTAS